MFRTISLVAVLAFAFVPSARLFGQDRPQLVAYNVSTDGIMLRWDRDRFAPEYAESSGGVSVVGTVDNQLYQMQWPGYIEYIEDYPGWHSNFHPSLVSFYVPPECRYVDGWTSPQCTNESWTTSDASYDPETFTLRLPGGPAGSSWAIMETFPQLHGVIPVPEPNTLILSSLGVGGLITWRRFRRRS
jgi:hypothetical protein